ncbi:MAG: DivIVA domain-containing protein [Acidimicrobiales bacterium]
MALDPDQQLDPTKIASREFSSSFRGYDADEVRAYLRQLSDQLRAEQSARPPPSTTPPVSTSCWRNA